MIRNVKFPRNLKGSSNILEGRHAKPGEDFSENKASHSRGSFVSSWESFNLSRKYIYKD